MKILLYCYEFLPIGGGAANASFYLCKEWARVGHSVLVVTSHFKDLKKREVVDGVDILRLPVGRQRQHQGRMCEMIRYMLLSVWQSKKIYRDFKPDVVVAFMTVPSGAAPLALNRRYGVPLVSEIGGGDVPGFYPESLFFYHLFSGFLIDAIWRRSYALIANGMGLLRLAQKRQKRVPVLYVPNGVDIHFYRPSNRVVDPKSVTLIFVGRFVDSQKKILKLIQNVSEFPHLHLLLVGDGPDREKIESFIQQNNLGGRIVLAGWLKGAALRDAYQRADVYVSASLWEGMPNSGVEAMACGLPLVLSRIPGHEELIDRDINGFLFDPQRDVALRECFHKLNANPQHLMNMGKASRTKVEREYSLEKMADKHIEIYREAIKARPSAEKRFDFGMNWREYSEKAFNEAKFADAKNFLAGLFQKNSFQGLSFLDIGCGSGIFSMAAKNLGAASVLGMDISRNSIETCIKNAQILKLNGSAPRFIEGDILRNETGRLLGQHDLVYAWGSLHHTGRLWEAIRIACSTVKPGGSLALGIYNKDWSSPLWRRIKKFYNHSGRAVQKIIIGVCYVIIFLGKWAVTKKNPFRMRAGMDFYYDVVDWAGGYPYEYASQAEVTKFVESLGFKLEKVYPTVLPTGNNSFLFKKVAVQ